MTRAEELAWAAGLFEGEGTWGFYKNHGQGLIRVGLQMRDEDVVKHFADVVGVGRTGFYVYPRGNHCDMWTWQCSGAHAMHVVELFYPYMGARRRAKADEILAEVLSKPSIAKAWKQPKLPL